MPRERHPEGVGNMSALKRAVTRVDNRICTMETADHALDKPPAEHERRWSAFEQQYLEDVERGVDIFGWLFKLETTP